MSEHKGQPKWNGVEKDIRVNGCFMPFNEQLGPVLMLLNDCDDYFCSIFSTEEKLRDHMTYLRNKGLDISYKIKQVTDAKGFMDSLREVNVRIMHDPQVISDDHTKWNEVIYDGDQWKFRASEN